MHCTNQTTTQSTETLGQTFSVSGRPLAFSIESLSSQVSKVETEEDSISTQMPKSGDNKGDESVVLTTVESLVDPVLVVHPCLKTGGLVGAPTDTATFPLKGMGGRDIPDNTFKAAGAKGEGEKDVGVLVRDFLSRTGEGGSVGGRGELDEWGYAKPDVLNVLVGTRPCTMLAMPGLDVMTITVESSPTLTLQPNRAGGDCMGVGETKRHSSPNLPFRLGEAAPSPADVELTQECRRDRADSPTRDVTSGKRGGEEGGGRGIRTGIDLLLLSKEGSKHRERG